MRILQNFRDVVIHRKWLFILFAILTAVAISLSVISKKLENKADAKVIEASTRAPEIIVDSQSDVVCPFCHARASFNKFVPCEKESSFSRCPECRRKIPLSLLEAQASTNLQKILKRKRIEEVNKK